MAEVFGLAAAGIGVAPIALELAKTIKKLKDYCRDVKTAREDIHNFVDEVDALHMILEQLTDLGITECPSSAQGLQRCHDLCAQANKTLTGIVSELQEGLKLHGRRTQLVFPLKKDKMKQLSERVASAKSSLLLACNVYLMWQTKMQATAQRQIMSEVYATILAQKDDHHRRFEDLLSGNAAIGQSILTLRAREPHFSRSDRSQKDSGTNLAMAGVWNALCSLGYRGWTSFFRSYRVVYDTYEDPAFYAIYEGDLTTLQRLICDGKASIHDRTYYGDSMLDIAVNRYEMDVVRWLHQMGAASAGPQPLSSRDVQLEEISHSIMQLSNDVQYIRNNIDAEFDDDDIQFTPSSGLDKLYELPLGVFATPIDHWNSSDLVLAAQTCFRFAGYGNCSVMLRSLLDLIASSKWKQEVWLHRRDDGSSLLHQLAMAYPETFCNYDPDWEIQARELFHEFLSQAVRAGADPHATTEDAKESPFAVLLRSRATTYLPLEMVTLVVQSWVAALAANGVDIVTYGDTETRLWRRLPLAESQFRIYGFTYGSRPEDWTVYMEHPGDAYAGIFWDAIEHPKRQLPGSWLEDCEKLWEDYHFERLQRRTYWRKRDGRDAWDEQHRQYTGILEEDGQGSDDGESGEDA